jgi:hypothetical protein
MDNQPELDTRLKGYENGLTNSSAEWVPIVPLQEQEHVIEKPILHTLPIIEPSTPYSSPQPLHNRKIQCDGNVCRFE